MEEILNLNNSFALLVGVGGENIEETIDDAKALYDILSDISLAGYPKENVFLLTGKEATKDSLIEYLDKIIDKTKDLIDATVFIYYSGHGGQFKSNIDKEDLFEYYLLTHGFNTADLENTMLNGKIFSEKIEEIKAEKLIVLLDCCYSGGIKSKSGELRKKAFVKEDKIKLSSVELMKQLRGGKGRVFISSCADNEQSVILPNSKNSLFTEVILEALRGAVSGDDNYVKVIDLMYHVLRQVPERIKKHEHQQNPVINEVKDLNSAYCLCLNSNNAIIKKSYLKSPINSPDLTENTKMDFIKNYSYNYNLNIVNNGSIGEATIIDKFNGNTYL